MSAGEVHVRAARHEWEAHPDPPTPEPAALEVDLT
jgi:hypothetical protein